MRILVVYMGEYPTQTGASAAERRVDAIARGIASQGQEVFIAVPRRDDKQISLTINGVDVVYLGQARGSGLRHLKSRLSFWSRLQEFVDSEAINWVLLYSPRIDGLGPAMVLRRKGVKVAAEFCDLRSSGHQRNSLASWLTWSSFKLDEALLPRVVDLNIAISQYLLDHVKALAPRTSNLHLPILVDNEMFKPNDAARELAQEKWGINSDDILFAYAGGLWKEFRVRDLVEAFAQIAEHHPKTRLVIAGRLDKSPRHDDIAGLIKRLGLEDRVVTPGWVSTEDVITIYSRADVLVLPQANNRFAVAALPTKLAEYSVMGRAIIATDVGDIPQYFHDGENALLVESESAEAIAGAMKRLIEDPELRRKLAAAAGRVALKYFDYREAGRRIVAVMEEIAN